jgi:hypothetical protein
MSRCLLLACIGLVSVVQAEEPAKLKVALTITAANGMDTRVQSYMRKHLKAIGDIEIVEEDEDLRITLLITKDITNGGEHLGYTFIGMGSFAPIPSLFDPNRGDLEQDILKYLKLLGPLYTTPTVVSHSTSARIDLDQECKDLVAHFDGKDIKNARYFSAGLKRVAQKRRAEQKK